MKEILNELENENVVSLASIKDCKYDKRIIWNIFSMYTFYDILSNLNKF